MLANLRKPINIICFVVIFAGIAGALCIELFIQRLSHTRNKLEMKRSGRVRVNTSRSGNAEKEANKSSDSSAKSSGSRSVTNNNSSSCKNNRLAKPSKAQSGSNDQISETIKRKQQNINSGSVLLIHDESNPCSADKPIPESNSVCESSKNDYISSDDEQINIGTNEIGSPIMAETSVTSLPETDAEQFIESDTCLIEYTPLLKDAQITTTLPDESERITAEQDQEELEPSIETQDNLNESGDFKASVPEMEQADPNDTIYRKDRPSQARSISSHDYIPGILQRGTKSFVPEFKAEVEDKPFKSSQTDTATATETEDVSRCHFQPIPWASRIKTGMLSLIHHNKTRLSRSKKLPNYMARTRSGRSLNIKQDPTLEFSDASSLFVQGYTTRSSASSTDFKSQLSESDNYLSVWKQPIKGDPTSHRRRQLKVVEETDSEADSVGVGFISF